VDNDRTDIGCYLTLRFTTCSGGQPSDNAWRSSTLRTRFPDLELADVTPVINRQRIIRTPTGNAKQDTRRPGEPT
jgi:hypothetical protein